MKDRNKANVYQKRTQTTKNGKLKPVIYAQLSRPKVLIWSIATVDLADLVFVVD